MRRLTGHIWFKSIAVVLIFSFLWLDITWAYPADSAPQNHNLAVFSSFQGRPGAEQFRETGNILATSLNIANYAFGDAQHGIGPLPISLMQEVLSNPKYGLRPEVLGGVDLSSVSLLDKDGKAIELAPGRDRAGNDDTVLVRYTKKDHNYILQIAMKGSQSESRLIGHEVRGLSDRYVVKIARDDYKEKPAVPEAAAQKTAQLAPIPPDSSEPIIEHVEAERRPEQDAAQRPAASSHIGKTLATALLVVLAPSMLFAGGFGVPQQPARVYTQTGDRRIYVQERKQDGTLGASYATVIKGVNWSPASTDSNPAYDPMAFRQEFFKWYTNDIPLMAQMGANTARLYYDLGTNAQARAVLDMFYKYGIKVIMPVTAPYYGDTTNSNNIPVVVNAWKSHPAIFGWGIGNEWDINYYYDKFTTLRQAAAFTEYCAQVVTSIDTNHPTISFHGEPHITISDNYILNGILRYHYADPSFAPWQPTDGTINFTSITVNNWVPSVNIWGVQLYRNASFTDAMSQWGIISTKPMFVSEFGADSYDHRIAAENQAMQRDFNLALLDEIYFGLAPERTNGVASGGIPFEWVDEWYKGGNPGVHSISSQSNYGQPDGYNDEKWFGGVKANRDPKLVFYGTQSRYLLDGQNNIALVTNPVLRVTSGQPAVFEVNGRVVFSRRGGDSGARGLNIAILNEAGTAVKEYKHFDTWWLSSNSSFMQSVASYLNGIPSGSIVMIAVADNSGLSNGYLPNEPVFQALEALGSTQIRTAPQASWALITKIGTGKYAETSSTSPITVTPTIVPTRDAQRRQALVETSPFVITGARMTNGNFQATFQSQTGLVYKIEYTDDLMSGNWTLAFRGLVADGSTTTWIDDGSFTGGTLPSKRFYRVSVIDRVGGFVAQKAEAPDKVLAQGDRRTAFSSNTKKLATAIVVTLVPSLLFAGDSSVSGGGAVAYMFAAMKDFFCNPIAVIALATGIVTLATWGVIATLSRIKAIAQPTVSDQRISVPVSKCAIVNKGPHGHAIIDERSLRVGNKPAFMALMGAAGFTDDQRATISKVLDAPDVSVQFWRAEADGVTLAPLLILGLPKAAATQFAVNFMTNPDDVPIFTLEGTDHQKSIVVQGVKLNLSANLLNKLLNRGAGSLDVSFLAGLSISPKARGAAAKPGRAARGRFAQSPGKSPADALKKVIARSEKLRTGSFTIAEYVEEYKKVAAEYRDIEPTISETTARNDLYGEGLSGMSSLSAVGLLEPYISETKTHSVSYQLTHNGKMLLDETPQTVEQVIRIMSVQGNHEWLNLSDKHNADEDNADENIVDKFGKINYSVAGIINWAKTHPAYAYYETLGMVETRKPDASVFKCELPTGAFEIEVSEIFGDWSEKRCFRIGYNNFKYSVSGYHMADNIKETTRGSDWSYKYDAVSFGEPPMKITIDSANHNLLISPPNAEALRIHYPSGSARKFEVRRLFKRPADVAAKGEAAAKPASSDMAKEKGAADTDINLQLSMIKENFGTAWLNKARAFARKLEEKRIYVQPTDEYGTPGHSFGSLGEMMGESSMERLRGFALILAAINEKRLPVECIDRLTEDQSYEMTAVKHLINEMEKEGQRPLPGAPAKPGRATDGRFAESPGKSPDWAMAVIILSPTLQRLLTEQGYFTTKDYKAAYEEVVTMYPWLNLEPNISDSTVERDLYKDADSLFKRGVIVNAERTMAEVRFEQALRKNSPGTVDPEWLNRPFRASDGSYHFALTVNSREPDRKAILLLGQALDRLCSQDQSAAKRMTRSFFTRLGRMSETSSVPSSDKNYLHYTKAMFALPRGMIVRYQSGKKAEFFIPIVDVALNKILGASITAKTVRVVVKRTEELMPSRSGKNRSFANISVNFRDILPLITRVDDAIRRTGGTQAGSQWSGVLDFTQMQKLAASADIKTLVDGVGTGAYPTEQVREALRGLPDSDAKLAAFDATLEIKLKAKSGLFEWSAALLESRFPDIAREWEELAPYVKLYAGRGEYPPVRLWTSNAGKRFGLAYDPVLKGTKDDSNTDEQVVEITCSGNHLVIRETVYSAARNVSNQSTEVVFGPHGVTITETPRVTADPDSVDMPKSKPNIKIIGVSGAFRALQFQAGVLTVVLSDEVFGKGIVIPGVRIVSEKSQTRAGNAVDGGSAGTVDVTDLFKNGSVSGTAAEVSQRLAAHAIGQAAGADGTIDVTDLFKNGPVAGRAAEVFTRLSDHVITQAARRGSSNSRMPDKSPEDAKTVIALSGVSDNGPFTREEYKNAYRNVVRQFPALGFELDISDSTVARALAGLCEARLLIEDKNSRPYIYHVDYKLSMEIPSIRQRITEARDPRFTELYQIVENTINNNRARVVREARILSSIAGAHPAIMYPVSLDSEESLNVLMTTAEIKDKVERLVGVVEEAGVSDDIMVLVTSLKTGLGQMEADSIVASLIVMAREAKPKGQKLIIGFDTDWIPGDRGSLERSVLQPIIREIEALEPKMRSMGLDNVAIEVGSGKGVADAVLKEAERTQTKLSNVVVLGADKTLRSDSFDALRSTALEKRAFLAGVDPSILNSYSGTYNSTTKQINVNLMEMLALTLELAAGKKPPQMPIIASNSYDEVGRMVTFLPKAELVDYDRCKEIYKAQAKTLESA